MTFRRAQLSMYSFSEPRCRSSQLAETSQYPRTAVNTSVEAIAQNAASNDGGSPPNGMRKGTTVRVVKRYAAWDFFEPDPVFFPVLDSCVLARELWEPVARFTSGLLPFAVASALSPWLDAVGTSES